MFRAIKLQFSASCAVLSLAGLAMTGCERKPPPPPVAPAPAETPASSAPLAPSTVDRAALLQAIAAARAAYAAGQPDAGESLAGRRFAVRQAFGCSGPAPTAPEGQARWSWTARNSAIEIALAPADWTTAPVIASGKAPAQDGETATPAAAPWEVVEGFWLTRPWLQVEACPAVSVTLPAAAEPAKARDGKAAAPSSPAPPTVPAAATPTAGLAAVFEAGGSRVGRRDGRAFAFTLRGEPLPQPPVGGFRLVIEGRFAAFPSGRAIRCDAPSPDIEPVCVAAAQIDRVAFEDASGKLLREWRQG